jgi:molybdenum cofactor cytidylyltransferase
MPDVAGAQVAAVVLAAGTSSRMGRNKLLLQVDREPLVHRTVARAAAAGLDPLIVVLGHQADLVQDRLADLPCELVLNPDYEQGVQSSLRAGIGAVPAEASAAMVILADMPFVTAQMIAALASRYRETAARLVVSRYGGVNAPPTLYDRSLFAELLAMDGPGCGKHVVRRHRHEALTLDWPDEALADLDVPGDYDRLTALVGTRQEGHHHAV